MDVLSVCRGTLPSETAYLDLVRSGASAGQSASVRMGFLPLSLEHLALEALSSIPVYLRTAITGSRNHETKFTLYCTPQMRFTEHHRQRLREAGVRFVYIPMQHQAQFRRQVEAHLDQVATDPAVAISAKSELVYETSVELINEVLAEQALAEKLPRVETVARAITTLVINDATAFSHLFAASQHDFYTATHMVNVGTWMVPLAYAMGICSIDELNVVCVAGMLHDIGKLFVPEEVLNKRGRLEEADWKTLKAHPQRGAEHLAKFDHVTEVMRRVVLEHHERMDGSGYPAGLRGEQIHLLSRICAVVDSFDAMTAFRPFKERTVGYGQALQILQKEAGSKYDRDIVDAWMHLMLQAEPSVKASLGQPEGKPAALGRRAHERFTINCSARVHPLECQGEEWIEHQGLPVTAHSISRGGLGFLSRQRITPSQYVRVYLMGQGTLANRTIEGQIVRCRAYKDGWHDVGLRVVSLEEEQLAAQRSAEAAAGGPGA